MKKGTGVLGLGCATLLAFALSTSIAHAEGAGKEVTVKMTDGAVFRGEVVESVPGQHITLRLATGEFRKLPWNLIAQGPGAGASPPEASSSATAGATVAVHVETDADEAVLQRNDDGAWVDVCIAPCTANVDSEAAYRIAGRGVVRSRPFSLPGDRAEVSVNATTGSTSTTAWGVVMIAVGGGTALFIGLPLLMVGAFAGSVDASVEDPNDEFDATPLLVTGGVLTAGGIALGIGGLMMLLNNSTTVDVSRSARPLNIALPGGLELTPRGLAF